MPIRVHLGTPNSGVDASQMTIHLATPLLAGSGVEDIGDNWELLESTDDHFTAQSGPWRFAALSAPIDDDLGALSQQLYHRLFSAMQDAQLVRIWNFVPDINGTVDGLENYQAFCLGRHEAFVNAFGQQAREIYSAASAVGVDDARLTVFALATTLPIQHLENPLQSPAYEYPTKYGPRPPSFSRATIVPGTQPAVYISGTAAVRGSDSVGESLSEQLDITSKNLRQIITRCEESLGISLPPPSQIRVYVRQANDQTEVCNWTAGLESLMTGNLVRSDICRRELLAEIEIAWPGALA